ncbi:hypothetical protein [Synechococcus sp. 7002]
MSPSAVATYRNMNK